MEQLKHKEGILRSVKENAQEIMINAKPNDTGIEGTTIINGVEKIKALIYDNSNVVQSCWIMFLQLYLEFHSKFLI